MTYKVYADKRYLIPLKTNVEEENLGDFGEIVSSIYDDFDKPKLVGYVLKDGLKKYYAFQEKG